MRPATRSQGSGPSHRQSCVRDRSRLAHSQSHRGLRLWDHRPSSQSWRGERLVQGMGSQWGVQEEIPPPAVMSLACHAWHWQDKASSQDPNSWSPPRHPHYPRKAAPSPLRAWPRRCHGQRPHQLASKRRALLSMAAPLPRGTHLPLCHNVFTPVKQTVQLELGPLASIFPTFNYHAPLGSC